MTIWLLNMVVLHGYAKAQQVQKHWRTPYFLVGSPGFVSTGSRRFHGENSWMNRTTWRKRYGDFEPRDMVQTWLTSNNRHYIEYTGDNHGNYQLLLLSINLLAASPVTLALWGSCFICILLHIVCVYIYIYYTYVYTFREREREIEE